MAANGRCTRLLFLLFLAGCQAAEPPRPRQHLTPADRANLQLSWPPALGRPYPDVTLMDQTGRPVRLSSFKGKPILIEPIGMTCQACNELAGGGKAGIGPFEGIKPEGGYGTTAEETLRSHGIDPEDGRFVYVHFLLYNMQMKGPTPDDARRWAKHFKTESRRNWFVLAGGEGLVNQASYNLIPGFQFVDKDFILRADAAGHSHPDPYSKPFELLAESLGIASRTETEVTEYFEP